MAEINISATQVIMFGVVAPVTGWLIAALIAEVVEWWRGPKVRNGKES